MSKAYTTQEASIIFTVLPFFIMKKSTKYTIYIQYDKDTNQGIKRSRSRKSEPLLKLVEPNLYGSWLNQPILGPLPMQELAWLVELNLRLVELNLQMKIRSKASRVSEAGNWFRAHGLGFRVQVPSKASSVAEAGNGSTEAVLSVVDLAQQTQLCSVFFLLFVC